MVGEGSLLAHAAVENDGSDRTGDALSWIASYTDQAFVTSKKGG